MKMDNTQLLAIINGHRDTALGAEEGELSTERALALDHYHGRPYGDEEDGSSKVVSRDLSETVGWIMPAILNVFSKSGSLGEFPPESAQDEQQAELESDSVNSIIMDENQGVILIHDSAWDALVLKNGYIKHWWEEEEETEVVKFAGLTEDELNLVIAQLEQDAEVKVIEQEEEIVMDLDGMAVQSFTVELEVTRKTGSIKVMAVPAEEVRVSKACRGSLQDSPFVEHVTTKRRYELLEMGMDPEFVDELTARHEDENSDEVNARDTVSDENKYLDAVSSDKSMDEIDYTEAYIRVDYDGDGMAELRKVVTVNNRIPPGKEWNERIDVIPLTGLVAKRVPHRHVGESIDDELADLQQIKTVLIRQALNNIYRTNNMQWLVNSRVHIPDFLQSLPGGVKRVLDDLPVDGAASPVPVQPILNQILPAIDMVESMKEARTGINATSTGLDPDVLKSSTKGAYLENLNRASQKVELIIRMLAEGYKELMLRVHELLIKHQSQPMMQKLKGQYQEVNPQNWSKRKRVKVKVGLGTGTEEEKREKLMIIAALQEKLFQMGMVDVEQAYNLFTDVAETLGDGYLADKYVMNPQQVMQRQAQQAKQGQPNPLAEAEQVKGQFAIQKEQMSLQFKGAIEQQKLQANAQMENMKREYEAQIQALKQNQQHQHDMHQLAADAARHAAEIASKEAVAAMNAEVQLMIAGIKADLGRPGISAGVQERAYDPETDNLL